MNRVALGLVVASLLSVGCSYHNPAQPTPPVVDLTSPTLLAITATVGSGATAGSAVIAATVMNAYRAPLGDVAVTFVSDSGTLTPTQATTNAKGIAEIALTGQAVSVKVTATAGTLTSSTLVALQAGPPPPPPIPPAPPVPPMTVRLAVSQAYAGQASTFSAGVNEAVPPISYVWQFGDGPTQTTSVASITHTYTTAATYQTSVAVSDAIGNRANAAQAVTIIVAPPRPLSVSLTCTAHILTIPTACQATVTDAGMDVTGTMTGFDWTFGDGASALASTASTTHTYAAPNTYTVTVKANGLAGRTGTATANVTVPASLVGVITVNCSTGIRLSVPPALSTCVVAATVGGTTMPSTWIGPVDWDWGDAQTSPAHANNSATHTYASANTFTVIATATIAGTTGPATGSTTTTIAP